jgi:hypothetical protein
VPEINSSSFEISRIKDILSLFSLFTSETAYPDFSPKQNVNDIIINLSLGKLKVNLYQKGI